jgi:hypothetical protein
LFRPPQTPPTQEGIIFALLLVFLCPFATDFGGCFPRLSQERPGVACFSSKNEEKSWNLPNIAVSLHRQSEIKHLSDNKKRD